MVSPSATAEAVLVAQFWFNASRCGREGLHALQFVDAHQLRHDLIALGLPTCAMEAL
jgi:hypothetical protein